MRCKNKITLKIVEIPKKCHDILDKCTPAIPKYINCDLIFMIRTLQNSITRSLPSSPLIMFDGTNKSRSESGERILQSRVTGVNNRWKVCDGNKFQFHSQQTERRRKKNFLADRFQVHGTAEGWENALSWKIPSREERKERKKFLIWLWIIDHREFDGIRSVCAIPAVSPML